MFLNTYIFIYELYLIFVHNTKWIKTPIYGVKFTPETAYFPKRRSNCDRKLMNRALVDVGSGKPLHFCQAKPLSFTRISSRPNRGYPKLDSTAAATNDAFATVIPCRDADQLTKTPRSAITRRLCRPESENMDKDFHNTKCRCRDFARSV